jgi:hypothetical protein
VINLLRAQATEGRAFVVVLGMSGGGKSSLVRAGVLPMLTRPGVIEGVGLWRRVVFQPSQGEGDLFDRLAVALVSSPESGIGLPEIVAEGTTVSRLAERLRHSPLSTAQQHHQYPANCYQQTRGRKPSLQSSGTISLATVAHKRASHITLCLP